MTSGRRACAIFLCILCCGAATSAVADLTQYWPLDDGATSPGSATAANLATGGNTGVLSAGGVMASWETTGLYGPLATRSSNPSTAAMRLETLYNDFMDGGDLGLSSTLAGGQATVSMWINPTSLSSELAEPEDGDRLFNQIGPTGCCTTGVGGSVRISDGGGLYVPTNGLQVFTNGDGGWRTLAAADSPSTTIVKDTWQHLAFVWNYGQLTSYLNGVDTGTVVSNFSYDSAGSGENQNFGVGARFQGTGGGFAGRAFDGLVDDVAIWSTALPADRIATLASGASPVDIVENPLPVPDPFKYPDPPAGTLVQYWPFDDGATDASSATAANLVVGGNVGQLSAGGVPESWVTTGLHGPLASRGSNPSTAALRLDTTNTEIVDGGDLGLHSWELGGSATVSMWIYPEELGGDPRLFTQIGPTDCCNTLEGGSTRFVTGDEGLGVEMWSNDSAGWKTMSDGDTAETAIVLEEWQHVAFVWNHDQVTMYLDGVEMETAVSGFAYDSLGTGTNQNFGIGDRFNSSGSTFDGLMDDVAIWEGALTPSQIAALAAGASPLDIGALLEGDYNNDGTVDAADYTVWRDALGTSTVLPNDATPGSVTEDDYVVWKNNFGDTSTGSGSTLTAVPEPTSAVLLIGMFVLGLFRRARRQ